MTIDKWLNFYGLRKEEELTDFFRHNLLCRRGPVSVSWCPACKEVIDDTRKHKCTRKHKYYFHHCTGT